MEHLSPQRPLWGTWIEVRFTEDFERQTKDASRNGASLFTGVLCGELRGRAPVLRTPRGT